MAAEMIRLAFLCLLVVCAILPCHGSSQRIQNSRTLSKLPNLLEEETPDTCMQLGPTYLGLDGPMRYVVRPVLEDTEKLCSLNSFVDESFIEEESTQHEPVTFETPERDANGKIKLLPNKLADKIKGDFGALRTKHMRMQLHKCLANKLKCKQRLRAHIKRANCIWQMVQYLQKQLVKATKKFVPPPTITGAAVNPFSEANLPTTPRDSLTKPSRTPTAGDLPVFLSLDEASAAASLVEEEAEEEEEEGGKPVHPGKPTANRLLDDVKEHCGNKSSKTAYAMCVGGIFDALMRAFNLDVCRADIVNNVSINRRCIRKLNTFCGRAGSVTTALNEATKAKIRARRLKELAAAGDS